MPRRSSRPPTGVSARRCGREPDRVGCGQALVSLGCLLLLYWAGVQPDGPAAGASAGRERDDLGSALVGRVDAQPGRGGQLARVSWRRRGAGQEALGAEVGRVVDDQEGGRGGAAGKPDRGRVAGVASACRSAELVAAEVDCGHAGGAVQRARLTRQVGEVEGVADAPAKPSPLVFIQTTSPEVAQSGVLAGALAPAVEASAATGSSTTAPVMAAAAMTLRPARCCMNIRIAQPL